MQTRHQTIDKVGQLYRSSDASLTDTTLRKQWVLCRTVFGSKRCHTYGTL